LRNITFRSIIVD